jgi:hypothetical protein
MVPHSKPDDFIKLHFTLTEKNLLLEKITNQTEFSTKMTNNQIGCVQREIFLKFISKTLSEINNTIKTQAIHFIPPTKTEVDEFTKSVFDVVACEPMCYIIALYYFKQFAEHLPVQIKEENEDCNFTNFYRYIYLMCIILSSKFWEDRFDGNSVFYEKFSLFEDIEQRVFNHLEILILGILNYDLYIENEDFDTFLTIFKLNESF